MPDWLTIVIAVVGLLGTILGVLGVSGYLGERAKYKANKKNQQEEKTEEELEELRTKKMEDTFRTVYREESKPIQEDISSIKSEVAEIKHDLADNTVGTVTILRDRMQDNLAVCKSQGFATMGDKANWLELYNTYKGLGGNHFREYVDAGKAEMEALPSTPPNGRKKKSLTALEASLLKDEPELVNMVDVPRRQKNVIKKKGN